MRSIWYDNNVELEPKDWMKLALAAFAAAAAIFFLFGRGDASNGEKRSLPPSTLSRKGAGE